MPRIAFATYAALPTLDDDDRLAAAAVRRLGLGVEAAVWNDPGVAWHAFDAVVVRSCWDYHHHAADFLRWVGRLEATGVALWNPPDVIRWNLEKSYLQALEAAGVPVVPTVWLPRGAAPSLPELLARHGWARAVLKPSVSLNAYETWLTSVATAGDDQARLEGMLRRTDVMLQPFVQEVRTEGEWSFVFFGGVYSHAVLKTTAPGDFRVQQAFGGTHEARRPAPTLIAQARAVLDAVTLPCLYARVDGVVRGHTLTVMELELIEPSLFFDQDPEAPARFAAALDAAT